MKRLLPVLFLLIVLTALTSTSAAARPLRPGDINVPDGFAVDVAVEGLAAAADDCFRQSGAYANCRIGVR